MAIGLLTLLASNFPRAAEAVERSSCYTALVHWAFFSAH